MGLYAQFETDRSLELDGLELAYPGGAVFKMRRAGGANKAFNREVASRLAKYNLVDKKNISEALDAEMDRVLMEVYADTVLVSWEGVTDREDNPLECNRENFVQIMTDLPDLWTDVRSKCIGNEMFLRSVLEAAEKNY